MQDVTQGALRVRAWPRTPKPAKTTKQRAAQEIFRQYQLATKYWQPQLYLNAMKAVEGTPLLPRDIMTMIMSNRLCAFELESGGTLWPMPARNDVSLSLDTITQTVGWSIRRGAQGWEGYDPATAGSGGSRNWWYQPPLAADLLLRSGDGTQMTLTDDDDAGLLIDPGPIGTERTRMAYQVIPVPGIGWRLQCRITAYLAPAAFAGLGLILYNSTSGRNLRVSTQSNAPLHCYQSAGLLNAATDILNVGNALVGTDLWFALESDGAIVSFQQSPDGKNWWQIASQPLATYVDAAGGQADEVGVFARFVRTSGPPTRLSVSHWQLTNA